ncbi:CHASE domain-containing sensor histidine kinase [Thermoleptolyngbya sp.]
MAKPLLPYQIALGLALSLGLGLSVLAAALVHRWEATNRQVRFQRQIENLGTALQRSLNRYTDMLAFLGDYYTVEPESVSRQTFAAFVGRSLQTHPGVQALEWAPLVMQAERTAFEQQVQQEGFATFQIRELDSAGKLLRAGDRPFYVPVTYVEPLAGNESALGYDLSSNLVRGRAIALARDSGRISTTGRIRLVQEQRDQFGFLVFLPLYATRQTPTNLAQRRQAFAGVLLGVFRVSDVVEESLQDLQYAIDFSIYDQGAPPAEQFLGRYDATQGQVATQDQVVSSIDRQKRSLCPTAARCTHRLTVGQRQWTVAFSPAAGYSVEPGYGAIATLLSGLLLTSGLVTFLHQINRELEQTKSLSELRFRFFSMASHELRTPLSTILLTSENLQHHADQFTHEQRQSSIQRIHLTAKRMSQQIADLLMLTRAEVKQLELHPEILDLEPFCQQIADEVQLGILQPIRFHRPAQPIQAFLDKKLVRSLLTNLLSNAAKYSPPDAPIDFRLYTEADEAVLQIGDRGIGIPSADQDKIATPFHRGSNVGDISGTGLGLAIVKTCVELHRGEWAIASEEGTGTTVVVRLPLE